MASVARLRRLIAAAVAAAALPACARVAPAVTGGARHAWTQPGVLRIAALNDPDTLSPLVGNFQIDADLSMFWAGYFFNYDDRGRLVPELAVEEPTVANGGISRDGRTIVYKLRRGVRWHDGAPFTADDVIFTWHAVMNPRNNVGSRVGFDRIVGMDKRRDGTIAVRLDRPFAPFVATFFTMSANPVPVYPKHLLAAYPDLNRVPYNAAPVGTGPFKVQEWHRGATIRFVANRDYWRGPPKLAEVRYRAIPDENTILTALRSHEIDFWYNIGATMYPGAHAVAGTRALLTPFVRFTLAGFNLARPALRDVRVRRALAYAIDRRKIIDGVTYGVNLPGDGDQPPPLWAHDGALRPYPYDPAGARALLDAAGWRSAGGGMRARRGVPLEVVVATTAGDSVGNRLAVLLQSAWRAVGVATVVRSYASGLMFASYGEGGILQTGKFDVEFFSWLGGVDPDDSTLVMCDQFPPHGQNNFRFCDAAVDGAERAALATYDRARRKRAYDVVQERLQEQVPFVTLWFNRHFDVVSDDLRGYRPAHAVTPFWNTWEYAI